MEGGKDRSDSSNADKGFFFDTSDKGFHGAYSAMVAGGAAAAAYGAHKVSHGHRMYGHHGKQVQARDVR
jgi:hypothetical protein